MLVLSSPFFIPYRTRIVQLAVDHRLPTMFINKDYVLAGGLMSYGADFTPMLVLGRRLRGQDPQGSDAQRSAGRAGLEF